MLANILLIEDDAAFRGMIVEALRARDYEVSPTGRAEDGIDIARSGSFDLILTDVKLPGMSGVEAIPKLKEAAPDADIIVMTAYSAKETAVEAVRLGAYDFFSKPFSLSELDVVIRRALEKRRLQREVLALRETLRSEGPTMRIIGNSRPMQEVKALVERIAPLDTTVLVTGESGTGKELIADTLRSLSRRSSGPFVKINCAAIPEHLFENELFGHEKGAFTGASTPQPGKFELAHRGTIMLDEIGDMPLLIQPKLLRVVEQKQVERLGARRPVDVDVRIIAATNQQLQQRVRDKAFREDLYYRLSVAVIELPPLRQRKGDIPMLAEHFIKRINATLGLPVKSIATDALAALEQHHWPGNVRQLANTLERAAIHAASDTLTAGDIATALGGPKPSLTGSESGAKAIDLRATLHEMERKLIVGALNRAAGRQTEAAVLLGLTPKNLWAKIRKHDIDPKTQR
ncbi:MAG: sigma-54 dependent transcriptional regulator [Proteobacteria bacterium]|nr:sigma-54 dependent transcriptional regulator [Pseudomonadota bacterium]